MVCNVDKQPVVVIMSGAVVVLVLTNFLLLSPWSLCSLELVGPSAEVIAGMA